MSELLCVVGAWRLCGPNHPGEASGGKSHHVEVSGYVLRADRDDPILTGAPTGDGVPARLGQVVVIARGETGQPVAVLAILSAEMFGRPCIDPEALHRDIAIEVAVTSAGTEVTRSLAADANHLIGDRAKVVLGLRVALPESQAADVASLDVRDVVTCPADAGLEGLRGRAVESEQRRENGQPDLPRQPTGQGGPCGPNGIYHGCGLFVKRRPISAVLRALVAPIITPSRRRSSTL